MSIVPLAQAGQAALTGLGIGNATVAVTASDVKAITTSRTRGENLELEGYTFKRQLGAADVVYVVKGPDTINGKGKRTTHGPYEVNLSAGTCTCAAFANRDECPHIPGARKFHEGDRSRRLEVLEREMWALREVGGGRLRIERDAQQRPLIMVFRSKGLAEDEAKASLIAGESVEVVALDLVAAMADGRYGGIRHMLRKEQGDVLFGAAPNTDQHGQKKPEPTKKPVNPWPGLGARPYIPTDEEARETLHRALAQNKSQDFD